jgi:hypothetical protein
MNLEQVGDDWMSQMVELETGEEGVREKKRGAFGWQSERKRHLKLLLFLFFFMCMSWVAGWLAVPGFLGFLC